MNVAAVSAFIRSKFNNLPDGIEIYENEDKTILFPIRNAHTKKPEHYVLFFVKRGNDPNKQEVSKYGVRIPDHSELGASRLGWQSRLKHLLDKELEKFREELKK